MRTLTKAELRRIIDLLHCPLCAGKWAAQAQTTNTVKDIWACDTDECPCNWETGNKTWTLGLRS